MTTPSQVTQRWRTVVRRLLRAEMNKRGVDYKQLSQQLAAIGVQQSADNLRSKINKGILGAQLLLQLWSVLNVRHVDMNEIREMLEDQADLKD